MNREKLNLTKEQAEDILFGDNDEYKIISDKMVSKRRWSVVHSVVIQRKSDGKYFKDRYEVGATENQEQSPYEYVEPNFTEVFPVTKTYIDYE